MLRSKKFWLIVILLLALLGGGVGGYYYWMNSNDQKVADGIDGSEDEGTAFDWRTGEVLYDYEAQTEMPSGWKLYQFEQTLEDNKKVLIPVWLPEVTPEPGARTLKAGMTGDDVKVLQSALNTVKPDSTTDKYYFAELAVNGTFDEKTGAAVKKMREYFDLSDSSEADQLFFSQLLRQVITKGDEDETN